MMKKEEFDQLIKQNLLDEGCGSFGYALSKTYELYYTQQEFAAFVARMQQPPYQDAYHAYASGKGSELREQQGRYGTQPPKMASVASSSRFCYLALRDGAEALGSSGKVRFEYGCPITGVPGIPPQLDACVPEDHLYIEAKCHEIFDPHRIIMKGKYKPLLCGTESIFGLECWEELPSGSFRIPSAAFGVDKPGSMFDIKQLLCHLLGIASQKDREEPATLVYLFFKPKGKLPREQAQVDAVFDALRQEIRCIFHSAPIQRFTQANHIRLTAAAEYAAVMEPLTGDNRICLSD